MEYYLAIKRNEVLIHATTWMNPENIMLSQAQQDKYYGQISSLTGGT